MAIQGVENKHRYGDSLVQQYGPVWFVGWWFSGSGGQAKVLTQESQSYILHEHCQRSWGCNHIWWSRWMYPSDASIVDYGLLSSIYLGL